MRLARKLFLLAAMAITALAMTAGTANAQIEVLDEPTGEHCGTVTTPTAHTAAGGCLVEFQSEEEIPLHAYIPGKVTLSDCEVHITARIGEDGEGYVTKALLTEEPGSDVPCTRTPCDEAEPSHAELLWPIHLREAAGEESIEATFCLRPITDPDVEGQGNTPCTVHLEVTDLGNHDYEIGHSPSESFCEPGLPFPVSLESLHFLYEEGSDKIEIIH